MVDLYEKATGEQIGTITEEQLRFLQRQLEEETAIDQDYTITPMTVDYFAAQGADPELVGILQKALGDRKEVIIEWRSPES